MLGGHNVFLVGMMGAGKTTAGRLIARRLKRPFYDSDHEIERRCGVKVPVIFDIEGEAGFRQREAAAIAELTALEDVVLATGGYSTVYFLSTNAVNCPSTDCSLDHCRQHHLRVLNR